MSTIKITNLTTKDTDDIMTIFSEAFENYPLMEFIFGDSYQQSMKHLTKLMCDEASEGDMLLGAFVEGKLQGFAFITPPQNEENNDDIESTPTSSEEAFATAIGEEALMRMEAYLDLKKANKPSSPHFYINTLAVNPQNQGKGIASAMLSHIHQMSEQDSDSNGVALDTQTQKNVGYYERFGYAVSSTADLESVKNWFMFRPNFA
ncbi:acetyltransferase [Rivularia sp. PCC 7116]|uniref:GNAT family N-acetyltransferase n=1 Tax=Rivularia sp. PCC 7116 TaxID=373994 RepID=UPI00029ED952|nr:GNAT family N-acetyltransferase [Rivularia sp. PCC 7116]AFY56007.1 acetyltransferase [Rivularia sp. PCC 7116]